MATVYFPNESGVTLYAYGKSGVTPSSFKYYVRIAITETAVSDTQSTYNFVLQAKNGANQAWWSGTSARYQPKLYLYVNNSQISFTCPGSSTASTTGYFRTASNAYTATTTWTDIGTATGLTVTNTFSNPASITIGFKTTKGTGDTSEPYGIATCTGTTMTYYNGSKSDFGFTFETAWTASTDNGAFTKKQAYAYIKVNGSWKQGIPWVKVNGTWKKGLPWVKVNGTWKHL